jgi:RNA polymerase sigma-54 factor
MVATRLDLRQAQSLVMTPQLQQAIKLLQYSNLELATFVQEEMARNPLLEMDTTTPDSPGDDGNPFEEALTNPAFERLGEVFGGDLDIDAGQMWNASGNTPFSDLEPWKSPRTPASFGEDENTLEQTYSRPVSLKEHLSDQIGLAFRDPRARLIAAHLTDLLDESGYLRVDLAGESVALGCPLPRLEKILGVLQTFEPAGVYARSLAECLTLQLADRKQLDGAMHTLVANMDILARGEYSRLMRLCKVTPEQLKVMIATLKSLNPRPGQDFASERADTLIPDVVMTPGNPATGQGGWRLELNPATLPRALVNKRYYVEVTQTPLGKDDKVWLSDCLNSANWLVKALDQRARTILKVSAAIVARQERFLKYGVTAMKPLVLREIAEETGLHESTVSRVTANKAIATPRGTFELRYFFSSSLGDGFGAASARTAQARIKALVEAEEPRRPLSDDQLTALLQKDGIDIARRTVAKYREALRIPSSTERRRARRGQ